MVLTEYGCVLEFRLELLKDSLQYLEMNPMRVDILQCLGYFVAASFLTFLLMISLLRVPVNFTIAQSQTAAETLTVLLFLSVSTAKILSRSLLSFF